MPRFLYFPDTKVICSILWSSYTGMSPGKLFGIFFNVCGPLPSANRRKIMMPIMSITKQPHPVKQARLMLEKAEYFLVSSPMGGSTISTLFILRRIVKNYCSRKYCFCELYNSQNPAHFTSAIAGSRLTAVGGGTKGGVGLPRQTVYVIVNLFSLNSQKGERQNRSLKRQGRSRRWRKFCMRYTF